MFSHTANEKLTIIVKDHNYVICLVTSKQYYYYYYLVVSVVHYMVSMYGDNEKVEYNVKDSNYPFFMATAV